MIRSNLRLKLLGLSAMLLGLMAFGAGSAQAETGANWMVNGSNVTSTLLPTLQLAIENEDASLLTKIGGSPVKFLCKEASLIGAKLELSGTLTSGGKVKFSGCKTFLIIEGVEKESTACIPKGGGEGPGSILSNPGKGLLKLHETKPVTEITPVSGETFATMEFGEECSLPETVPVKGILFIKDCKGEGEKELVTHLIEQGPLTHLYVISDTAEHAANIDGSANVALAGEHVNMKWSGLPG